MLPDLNEALRIAAASEACIMTGFDDCIIGIASRCGCPDLVVYDVDLILKQLEADGMDPDDALDYYEFNQLNAFVGEGTPLFLEKIYGR